MWVKKYDKAEMIAMFRAMAEEHVGPKRKAQVLALIDHLEEKSDFFSAPASTKKSFHLAEFGGLAMHTWNFMQVMIWEVESIFSDQMAASLFWGNTPDKSATDIRTLRESAVIVALCHDLNKSKLFNRCYYVPNYLKGGKQSDAEPYRVSERVALGSSAQLLLASHFIDLKADEAQAIRYAEGLYDRSFQQDIGNKEELLTYLAHFSDMKASQIAEWCNPWTRDHTLFKESMGLQDTAQGDASETLAPATMPLPGI